MIGYIKGTLEEIYEDSVIVENQGIGYLIYTSDMTIADLPGKHQQVKLFTHLHCRENECTLYGFLSQEELEAFRLLIAISNIGPKVGLSVLSAMSPHDLAVAVVTGDKKSITRAKGVGKKGAELILLELKDKWSLEEVLNGTGNDEGNAVHVQEDQVQDTVLALVSLGYSDAEALKAIRQVKDAQAMSSEELLKAALKKMM